MNELWAADLNRERFLEIFNEFPSGGDIICRCWLDAPDGWALDYWNGITSRVDWNGAGRFRSPKTFRDVIEHTTNGRIFSPAAELKWRFLPALEPNCYRVVYLGSGFNPAFAPDLQNHSALLLNMTQEKKSYPLWGHSTHHTPDEWVELRIPHRLKYPVECPSPINGRISANIEVEIWKDAAGASHFIRLCQVTI